MTQEDKQLLLNDLCARLPYGVKVNHYQGAKCLLKYINLYTFNAHVEVLNNEYFKNVLERDKRQIFEFKPYLRPMSSMTEEEREEYKSFIAFSGNPVGSAEFIDWLNAHHFDFRGLIEKGLAIEATEGMYKIK